MELTLLTTKDGARILPKGFRPCHDCVIVGARGRRIQQHVGNRRFLDLVKSELTEYADADNKTEKSYVLAKVLYTVRRWKGDGLKVGFVKWDSALSRWIAPKDSVARVTVAQAFRDALSLRYSSSKKSKQRRRQIQKGYISDENPVEGNDLAQDSDKEDDGEDEEVRQATETQPLAMPHDMARGTPLMMDVNANAESAGGNFGFGMGTGGAFCFPTGVSSFPSMTMSTTPAQMYMSHMNTMPFYPSSFGGGMTMPLTSSMPFFSASSMMPPCTCCLSRMPAMGTTYTNSSRANLWRSTWQQPLTHGQPPFTKDLFDTVPMVFSHPTAVDPPTSPTSVACDEAYFGTAPKLPLTAEDPDSDLGFDNTGMRQQMDFRMGQMIGHLPF